MGERPAIERGISFQNCLHCCTIGWFIRYSYWNDNHFQQITLFGTGDPKIMAGGISQALVTGVLGLVVAIPTTLAHILAVICKISSECF